VADLVTKPVRQGVAKIAEGRARGFGKLVRTGCEHKTRAELVLPGYVFVPEETYEAVKVRDVRKPKQNNCSGSDRGSPKHFRFTGS
jgi:hypothetical protein